MSVSVTGKTCALGCSHCGGHYLKHMVDIKDLETKLDQKKPSSILVSGGCDLWGKVPLGPVLHSIQKQAKGCRLNVHPGIADLPACETITETASVISFDFVLDETAISQAFHGKWTPSDYVDTFRNLSRGKAEVVPHILVGLRKGTIAKEYDAVDFLISEGVKKVVFIVFIPTKGTLWEHVEPPSAQDVAKLLFWARSKNPSLDICLGCMRPGGRYRQTLDPLAVSAGVDRIVMPHPDALAYARSLGARIVKKEECCAFD